MLRYYFDITPERKAAFADVQWNYTECPTLHDHDHWEFCIITNGSCRNCINGKDYIMQKGNAILIRPADCHYLVNANADEPTFSHINLILRDAALKEYCDFIQDGLFGKLTKSAPTVLHLSDFEYNKCISYTTSFLSQKFVYEDCTLVAKLYLLFVTENVLSKMVLQDSHYPEWIYAMLRKINDPSSVDAFPRDILAGCPYSHTYVSRVFKMCTGQTLVDYINRAKMTKACELLVQSDLTTLEIANRLGFYSLSYFNHLFKDKFGVSPRQYIHNIRGR